MKATFLYFIVFCSLFTFTSCTDHKPEPAPEPIVQEDRCRLLKVSIAYNGRPGTSDGGGQEFFYSDNRIVKQTDSRTPGVVENYSVFEYDGAGRIITQKQYEQSTPTTFYAKWDFIYDNASRLISEKVFFSSPSGNLSLSEEKTYTYDGSGKVDSSWNFGNTSRGYGPVFLNTFEYDQNGNRTKTKSFEVQANGSLKISSTSEFLNYDSQRNPESLSTFSLRQLNPVTLFQKNNYQKSRLTQTGGSVIQEIDYSYTYNTDGLVTERKNVGNNISEIYSYGCN